MPDKNEIKEALRELQAEEKTAAEKVAQEEADAFDLGMQVRMREMGITEKSAQDQFLALAQRVATASRG